MHDLEWKIDWMNIVCIHTPCGPVTWHIHDSDMKYFTHLENSVNHWDGYSTEEKYARLSNIYER